MKIVSTQVTQGHFKLYQRKVYYLMVSLGIERASLVFTLRDVTRFAGFLRRLVHEVLGLVFDPMLKEK